MHLNSFKYNHQKFNPLHFERLSPNKTKKRWDRYDWRFSRVLHIFTRFRFFFFLLFFFRSLQHFINGRTFRTKQNKTKQNKKKKKTKKKNNNLKTVFQTVFFPEKPKVSSNAESKICFHVHGDTTFDVDNFLKISHICFISPPGKNVITFWTTKCVCTHTHTHTRTEELWYN